MNKKEILDSYARDNKFHDWQDLVTYYCYRDDCKQMNDHFMAAMDLVQENLKLNIARINFLGRNIMQIERMIMNVKIIK